jgi:hypothetical protein
MHSPSPPPSPSACVLAWKGENLNEQPPVDGMEVVAEPPVDGMEVIAGPPVDGKEVDVDVALAGAAAVMHVCSIPGASGAPLLMSADGSQVPLSSLRASNVTAYTEEEAIEPTAIPEKKARKRAPRKAKAPPNPKDPVEEAIEPTAIPEKKAGKKAPPNPTDPPKPKAPKSAAASKPAAAKRSAAKPLPGRLSKKAREEWESDGSESESDSNESGDESGSGSESDSAAVSAVRWEVQQAAKLAKAAMAKAAKTVKAPPASKVTKATPGPKAAVAAAEAAAKAAEAAAAAAAEAEEEAEAEAAEAEAEAEAAVAEAAEAEAKAKAAEEAEEAEKAEEKGGREASKVATCTRLARLPHATRTHALCSHAHDKHIRRSKSMMNPKPFASTAAGRPSSTWEILSTKVAAVHFVPTKPSASQDLPITARAAMTSPQSKTSQSTLSL